MSIIKNNLLVTRQILKLIYDPFFRIYVSLLRFFKIISFNVPPNSLMRRTSGKSIWRFYYSSLTTSLPIATLAKFSGISNDTNTSILDFGCGAGGQIRNMLNYFQDTDLYGCDVDSASIDWATKAYPSVTFSLSNASCQLPYKDNQFDLVYSVSTFSHFSVEVCEFYLSEFSRILKSGSLLILTIEGVASIPYVSTDLGCSNSSIHKSVDDLGYYHSTYSWLSSTTPILSDKTNIFTNFDDNYGVTVFSKPFFIEMVSKFDFNFIGFSESMSCDRQDIFVFKLM